MSDVTNTVNQGGSSNPWKWTTIGLAGLVAAVLIGGIVRASFRDEPTTPAGDPATVAETEEQDEPAATAPAAPTAPPVRVAAAPPPPVPAAPPVRLAAAPPAPAPAAPPRPTAADTAACNDYAASVRTQPADVVKNGVIGGALGAAVGAATGAIAGGGKGAGKGAGIGAIVGATGGTIYGLNKKNQDDARSEQAYRQCMAQRGF